MEYSKLFPSLPNLITLARLLLAPLAVAMIASQRFAEAFLIFVVAGISDALDGFIAKRFKLTSELGAYLDALADKALLISIYVTMAISGVAARPRSPFLSYRAISMILAAVVVSWLLANPVAIRPVPSCPRSTRRRRSPSRRSFLAARPMA